MEDDEIRKMLEEYSDYMADTYDKKYTNQPEHTFSPAFEKKMQRLIRNQKRYGRHAVMGGRIVKAASILLVCGISLVGAAHISAKYFGMNPWKELVVNQGDMDQVQFQKKKGKEETSVVRKNMIPTYVPEGFEMTYKDINLNELFDTYDAVWEKEDENGIISFSSIEIVEDSAGFRDNEFIRTEKVSVMVYEARLCYKEDGEIILMWNDETYENLVNYANTDTEEVIMLAESLYEIEEKK